MIKRFIGAISLLLLLTVCLVPFNVAASAQSVYVYDEGGILNADEEESLSEALAEASERTGYTMLVLTSDTGSYYDNSYYIGENYVVFVIEYDKYGVYDDDYYYYLDTYGDAYDLITDSEVNRILDTPAVYNNIKGGDIYEGLCAIIPVTVKALEGRLKPPVWKVLVPCIIAGLAVALTVAIVIYVRYKRKLKSAIYPIEQFTRHRMIISRDTFAGSFVTRTRRPRSSSSRSGGGRSGGGGGGGRRGGR